MWNKCPTSGYPLCVDCEHHRSTFFSRHQCLREVAFVDDLVLGSRKRIQGEPKNCYDERKDLVDRCGQKGVYFQSKR